ncbi:MAG: DUF1015 domain-containing protein [Magnetococcales bacterium]|nr:DUF1015 domain-containing protein [Magnetococcales bacterium]
MNNPKSLIHPFPGLRPRSDLVEEISAPPYDVINTEEARAYAEDLPLSFLHVSKAQIDLGADVDQYDDAVYETARNTFEKMKKEGYLVQDDVPCLYIYRLVMNGREQVGVMAAASVDAYLNNRIKKHELTRPQKEEDRTRFANTIEANSGPVFLTYRQSEQIDTLVQQGMQAEPEYDFTASDDIKHTLWVVRDKALIQGIVDGFDAQRYVYVADGHHRSAAASRVCMQRRAVLGDAVTGMEPFNRFLTVLFPDSHMHIMDYNRVVSGLNGLDNASYLKRLTEAFEVKKIDAPYKPTKRGEFGMYLDGQWYCLSLDSKRANIEDPVARLDVSLLQDHLLDPILGVTDPRRDVRIDFVGGIRGMEGLMARVDSGEMTVAFSLFPTSMDDLMRVADADKIMPPKSTWFEPKLRDGLVVQTL